MSGTDCHNPQGAFAHSWRMAAQPRMDAQAKGNEEPCLNCHRREARPFGSSTRGSRRRCGKCHVTMARRNSAHDEAAVVFPLCWNATMARAIGRHGRNGVFPLAATHNLADRALRTDTRMPCGIHGSNAECILR